MAISRRGAWILGAGVLFCAVALLLALLRAAASDHGFAIHEVVESPRPAPERQGKPIPGGGARSLAAGGNRSCAVMSDRTVRCWGDDRPAPAAPDKSELHRALHVGNSAPDQVSMSGTGYVCARSKGAVRCWAADVEGGQTVGEGPPGDDFVALWTGPHSACARRRDGEVWCWGRGEPWLDPDTRLDALHLPGLDGADELTIQRDRVCLRRSGEVFCTAEREIESLRTAGAPRNSSRLVEAKALVGCGRSSCATGGDERVWCWSAMSDPVIVLEDSKQVRELRALGDAICAIDAEGRSTCWACDWLRRDRPMETLGNVTAARWFSGRAECLVEPSGTVTCSGTIPPAGNGAALSDAPSHRLAGISDALDVVIDRGEVCTLGRERRWRCSPRMLEGRPKESTRFPAPELITSPPLTAQVAVHRFALCFVQDDGVATCHARTLGAPVVLPHVRRLVVGNHHACAVTTSDELWCFGANESGQALGNPLPSNVSSPTKIMGSVLDVAVGLRHTCALERDGKIVCFGDNSRGQLGLNGERDAAGRWRVPNLGHPATQIVAGYEQTCALANSGQVSCWGARTPRSNEVRAIRGLSSKARQLAASGHHTCALLESGTVACWQRSGDTAEVVRGSEGSVDLAVGDAHACVRTGSGSVRCWGSNELGQLGRDLPAVRTALSVPRNVLQVSYPVDSHSATAAEVAW